MLGIPRSQRTHHHGLPQQNVRGVVVGASLTAAIRHTGSTSGMYSLRNIDKYVQEGVVALVFAMVLSIHEHTPGISKS